MSSSRHHTSSLSLLTALVLLASCLTVAEAYNYRCLTDDTPDTVVGQYEIIKMRRPLRNCEGSVYFCDYAVLLSTDRYDHSSTIYLLTANVDSCQASRDQIVRAAENQVTDVTFQKIETHCHDLRTREIHNWRLNRYMFNGLTQCIDSLCLPQKRLRKWHEFQQYMCRRYLRRRPGASGNSK